MWIAARTIMLTCYVAAATRPPSPLASPLPASPLPSGKHKVAIVGSGSWGTALAKIAAENIASRPEDFEPEVRMWVREKQVSNLGHRMAVRSLTSILRYKAET